MKTSDMIIVGGAAIIAYALFRNATYIAGQAAQVPTGGLTWGAQGLTFNANIPGSTTQSIFQNMFGGLSNEPHASGAEDQTMNSRYFRRKSGNGKWNSQWN